MPLRNLMPGRSCTAVAGNPRKAYKFADYLHIASAPGARFRFFLPYFV